MKPYNKNCKTANVKKSTKIAGATFKITAINTNAFKKCIKLTKINIGANVTKIGKKSFYGCKNLKTIYIKTAKIKSIGSKAFYGINKKAKFKVTKSIYKKKTLRKKYTKLIKKAGFKKVKITK